MIASIDAVLDEQDEQRVEDVYDPDIIAQLYTEIVSPLLREAYLVGLRDAQEATTAAEQIPDLKPVETQVPKRPTPKSLAKKSAYEESSPPVEGEELLHSNDLPGGDVNSKSEPSKKGTAPKRKNRLVRGKATELSPLVRRRDGTYI